MRSPGRIAALALMVAGAFALASLERALPNPFPMVRLGLGNIMTLVAFSALGVSAGVWVAVGRVFLVALLWGGLIGPTAVLSASGAAASLLVMIPLLVTGRFSLYGVSLGGAYAHILGQLAVASLLYVRSPALLALVPVMGVAAMITGIINAWAAGKLAAHLPGGIGSELSVHPSTTSGPSGVQRGNQLRIEPSTGSGQGIED